MRNKIIITTRGFVFYFFTALVILFFIIFIGGVLQLLCQGTAIIQNKPLGILGLALILWMIVYLVVYLRSNKIEVTEGDLKIAVVERVFKNTLLPKVIKINIELKNIESIIVATAKYIDETGSEEDKKYLNNFKRIVPFSTGKMIFPVNVWAGVKYTPLMKIIKKQGKPFMVDTKPFSKKDLTRLITALSGAGILVTYKTGE